jgi:pimeloyl-ACP methyl ester carboxylesterase
VVVLLAAAPAAARIDDLACLACVYDTITHTWHIPGHTRFGQDRLINEHCAALEYPQPEFRVTCDGTQVSEFEVEHVVNPAYTCINWLEWPRPYFLDESGERVANPDPGLYGVIEMTEQRSGSVRFKYTNPTDPPPSGEVSRDVVIGIEYDDRFQGTSVFFTFLQIHVYRPPVVMTHGLWSEAGAFAAMEEDLSSGSHHYPLDLLYRVDYSGTHASPFVDNMREVEFGVVSVIEQAADAGYAVGKVDLVGHSMGGILSRLYIQGFYYNHDVRRLVTCNTPHSGSQMANWLLDEIWDPVGIVCAALGASTGSCYEGAVCDLNVYSYGIHNLLNNPQNDPRDVQVHALSTVFDVATNLPQGTIASFVHTNYPAILQAIAPFCGALELLDDVFNGEDSDLVVALPSQAGGLQGLLTSVYPDQVHIGSTDNPAVIDRVRSLLNEAKNNDKFTLAGYDPPDLFYFTPTVCTIEPVAPASMASATPVAPTRSFAGLMQSDQLLGRSQGCPTANHASASLRAQAASALVITSPAPGTSLAAGQAFTVTVAGSADVASIILLLSHRGDELFMARLAGPAATFSLEVPDALVGEKVLVAMGLDGNGQPVATSNPVDLDITVPATLQGISVYPAALHLDPGRTGSLAITGAYDDGVARDLSKLPGTIFTFAGGHASRSGTSGVMLNERVDDVLTIAYQGITSPEVKIRALPPDQPQVPTKPVRRHLRRQ